MYLLHTFTSNIKFHWFCCYSVFDLKRPNWKWNCFVYKHILWGYIWNSFPFYTIYHCWCYILQLSTSQRGYYIVEIPFVCFGREYELHCLFVSACKWLTQNKRNKLSYAAFILACRLTLCRVSLRTSLAVSSLEHCGTAAMGSSQSGIAPELNRIQLSAICRCGQSGKNIDLSARRCLPLGHPWASSCACAVVQISSSRWRQAANYSESCIMQHQHTIDAYFILSNFYLKHSNISILITPYLQICYKR